VTLSIDDLVGVHFATSAMHAARVTLSRMTESEKAFIREARTFLENPSLLIRLANQVGKPLDKGLKMLPQAAQEKVQAAVKLALQKGLTTVTKTIPAGVVSQTGTPFREMQITDASETSKKQGLLHSAASFATGVAGGFFGVASLPIELPLSTAIMLRSIVSTANDFGMDINQPEVQLECLYVLSLGSSKSSEDDALDSAYWTSRVAFMDLIRQASREIEKSSAPYLVRFLASVAARFEIVVSEKALAELVPVIGALGGGVINTAFTNHFNDCARYHFGLRALEKKYGQDLVQGAYRA
jgi:EcsC protein family